MVEMLIIAGVMSALFFGIWYLGKFHDIQSTTIQAARYSAWERSAHGAGFTDAQVQAQVRARLFHWNQNAYKASDGAGAGPAWTIASQNATWANHDQTKRLIDRASDVTVSTSAAPIPSQAASALVTIFSGIEKALAPFPTGGEPLERKGLYTGTVNVQLADLSSVAPQVLPPGANSLRLTLSEKSTLLTDSWDAAGPAQVAARTAAFAPTSAMAAMTSLLTPITTSLARIEPAFAGFNPGRICPEVVPADRVSGGGNLPVYQNSSACF